MGAKVYSTIVRDSSGKLSVHTEREAGLPSGFEERDGRVTKTPTVLNQPILQQQQAAKTAPMINLSGQADPGSMAQQQQAAPAAPVDNPLLNQQPVINLNEEENLPPPTLTPEQIARAAILGPTMAFIGDTAAAVPTSPEGAATLAARVVTGALGGLLGGALAGGATSEAAVARITQTASTIGKNSVTVTTQRAFVGKPASTAVDKIFHAVREPATRFATNTKSNVLTRSFLGKLVKSPATWLATIGTYPFAGFIKEEALQTLSFAVKTASDNKDTEGMAMALADQEDFLDPTQWERVLNAIPFVNIVKQLKDFYKAARRKLEIDRRFLETLLEEEEAGETEFQKQRREARELTLTQREEDTAFFERQAEETRARELGERETDTEFFERQAEERRKTAEGERVAETQRFADIRTESERFNAERIANETARFEEIKKGNLQEDVDLAKLWGQYYEAIAAKDFTLRDQILKQIEDFYK